MYSPTPTIADSRTGLSEIPLPDSVKVQMISLPDDVKVQLIPLPDSMKVQFRISSGNGKNWERGKLECLIHAVVVSHAVVVRKFAMPLQNHSRCRCTEQHFFFYVPNFCNHCCYAHGLRHDGVDGNLYMLRYCCSQLLLLEMVSLKWMLIPNQHVRHHKKQKQSRHDCGSDTRISVYICTLLRTCVKCINTTSNMYFTH